MYIFRSWWVWTEVCDPTLIYLCLHTWKKWWTLSKKNSGNPSTRVGWCWLTCSRQAIARLKGYPMSQTVCSCIFWLSKTRVDVFVLDIHSVSSQGFLYRFVSRCIGYPCSIEVTFFWLPFVIIISPVVQIFAGGWRCV